MGVIMRRMIRRMRRMRNLDYDGTGKGVDCPSLYQKLTNVLLTVTTMIPAY